MLFGACPRLTKSTSASWSPRAKYGDANLDDVVDGGDYTLWADNYLQTGKAWQTGDFNNDGLVDGGDYTLWADNFAPPAMATAVPEPSTCVLAISGVLICGLAAARRRRGLRS